MALHDELAELRAEVGPHVFEDPVAFRAAFDDFIPEGAATSGEVRLLVDAIATGSLQRLVAQVSIGADPLTALDAEAAVLARERGTVETEGARWALSSLLFAHGLTPGHHVSTRPAAGRVSSDPASATPSPSPTPAVGALPGRTAPRPTETSAQPPTVVVVGAPPVAASQHHPSPGRSRKVVVLVAAGLALAVVAVLAFVLLAGGDDPAGQEAQDSPDAEGFFPAAPADLPELPEGFPDTFEFDVRLPAEFRPTVSASFGDGVATEVFAGGDPLSPEAQAESGPKPTRALVEELVAAGVPPRVKFYALRLTGQDGGDVTAAELPDLFQDADLMTAYWSNVRDLLTALGEVGAPVELLPEPDLPGEVLSRSPDATTVPTVVAASGVDGLDGLPDTFAGWAQGWLALRDELAPQVRIGITVSPWQIQDDFLPDPPTAEQVDSWAARFGESYATLGARYDFLDNIMTYSEAGAVGPAYLADDRFFELLLRWVEGIATATDTRVVLDNVPVGNSVYRTVDDSEFHYRDAWVEWILGDDDFAHLTALRDAGVIGIVFGVDGAPAANTCPCDAAGDGVTNDADSGRMATSADDDGGYLAERLQAYAATGGLPL